MRAAEREQFFQNLSKAILEPITELQHANTFEAKGGVPLQVIVFTRRSLRFALFD